MTHKPALALAALLCAAALGLVVPTGSVRAATNPVITDCVAHGALTRTYTIAQLHEALGAMTAETREYTSCQDVINRALAGVVSGKGSGGTGSSGSSSFLPTPVIVLLVILLLAAITVGALAVRRRRGGDAVG